MSSVELLDNTRRINAILHRKMSGKVVFNDICDAMKAVLSSNVMVLSRKGKVLGTGMYSGIAVLNEMVVNRVGEFIDPKLNERLGNVLSTKENVNLTTLGFSEEVDKRYNAIVTPIDISGQRYGTLFIYRYAEEENGSAGVKNSYSIDDIILCEYGATVVGLEMMRSVTEESAEESRRLHGVQSALGTFSASETEALIHIFDELNGREGILVASRIADRVGITRSVIVNALRKLESAGVIESRSSGMKGTYIKVTNPLIFDEVNELKEKRESGII